MSIIPSFNPDPNAPPTIDYIIPAEGKISMTGNWARRLLENELDVGAMRPYLVGNQSYITRSQPAGFDARGQVVYKRKAVQTYNDANATLGYNDWLLIDSAVVEAAKPPLEFVQELRSRGLVYRLPNGIAHTMMQSQTASDITPAIVSMDPIREAESDRPVFGTTQFPIPVIHKDFQFSLREVLASRMGQLPLDTYTATLAARRVAEAAEQLAIGCGPNTNFPGYAQLGGVTTYQWNDLNVFGLMNAPGRITYSLTLPTAPGYTPNTTIDDVILMIKAAKLSLHNGPFLLLCGMYWDQYMDDDYKPTYNSTTLRQRLSEIDRIAAVRTVNFIPDTSLILVQLTSDNIRLVIGLDVTTVQWESHGGFQLNFKVLACMVPQLRTDFYGTSGIVHGA